MAERIVIDDPKLRERERKAIADLSRFAPDGIVSGIDSYDKPLGKRLSKLYKAIGYESRRDMIEAFGFRYGEGTAGGRPRTDVEGVLAEIASRYEGEPKPATLGQLVFENPDLEGVLTTAGKRAKELYGASLSKELRRRGLLQPKKDGVDGASEVEDDGITAMIEALAEIYREAEKPKTMKELERAHPEFAAELAAFKARCDDLFGTSPAKHLKKAGVLQARRAVDSESVGEMLETMAQALSDVPLEDRPSSFSSLGARFPQYDTFLKDAQAARLVTKPMLIEKGVVRPSKQKMQKKRKELAARCVRNASVGELSRLWRGLRGDAPVVRGGHHDDVVRKGLVAFDVVAGLELRETLFNVVDLCSDACVGDSVEVTWTHLRQSYDPSFEAYKRVFEPVLTFRSKRRWKPERASEAYWVAFFDRSFPSEPNSPLAEGEHAEVVAVSEAEGHSLVQVRCVFLAPLCADTVLYALCAQGAIGETDLHGGDEWRNRYAAYLDDGELACAYDGNGREAVFAEEPLGANFSDDDFAASAQPGAGAWRSSGFVDAPEGEEGEGSALDLADVAALKVVCEEAMGLCNDVVRSLRNDDCEESGSPESEILLEDGGDSDDERAQMLALLELAVLGATLGSPGGIPQEMLDELERAKAGDESIDLMDLAERMNNCLPDIGHADLSDVSFASGAVAEGPCFSIGLPDGWTALMSYREENMLASIERPFVLVQGEVRPDEDVSLCDRVIYSNLGGDSGPEEMELEYGIEDYQWAVRWSSLYGSSGNDLINFTKPNMVWDSTVAAVNTTCLVMQQEMGEGVNGLELDVYPCTTGCRDSLRIVLNADEVDLEEARAFAMALASTVEIRNPQTPRIVQSIDELCEHKADVDDFCAVTEAIASVFGTATSMILPAALEKFQEDEEENVLENTVVPAVKVVRDFSQRGIPFFEKLMSAYEVQMQKGATPIDGYRMIKALRAFDDAVFLSENDFDEDGARTTLEQSGIFAPTPELAAARARLGRLAAEVFSQKSKTSIVARDKQADAEAADCEKRGQETEEARREVASRRSYEECLREKESELSGDLKKAFDVIRQSGGAIDVFTIGEAIHRGGSPLELYNDIASPLVGMGLAKMCVEVAPGGHEDTKCKRFYTWDQVCFDDMTEADKSSLASKLEERIEALTQEKKRKAIADEIDCLELRLGECAFFAFGKKKEIKAQIDLARAELARLSNGVGAHQELLRVMENNLRALKR